MLGYALIFLIVAIIAGVLGFGGIAGTAIGIATLGYQGFTYTKQEKIAEIGDIQLTSNTQKTVYFPPMVGGLGLVAGIVLVVIARKGK